MGNKQARTRKEEIEYRKQSDDEHVIWKADNARKAIAEAEEKGDTLGGYERDEADEDIENERAMLEKRKEEQKKKEAYQRGIASSSTRTDKPYKPKSTEYVRRDGYGCYGHDEWGRVSKGENPWIKKN